MSNGFLSQEEIDSLLNGNAENSNTAPEKETLSDLEKDLLGEIGNISMGSASTALSTIINETVNITTPVVTVTTLSELRHSFEVPNIALQVKYKTGIVGENLLVMKITDATVIANLMMGKEIGNTSEVKTLSELEISAVSEAMNQMIGSSATSMATMFGREINISPPISKIWDDLTEPLTDDINDNDSIVRVSFKLTISNLIDSTIMQILPMNTARKIVSIMMGQEQNEGDSELSPKETEYIQGDDSKNEKVAPKPICEKPVEVLTKPKVEVNKASFQPLKDVPIEPIPKNIDLILDVPLDVSVMLGKTKKTIKEILNLGTGSLLELDKLAEEPVEILVNGKKVAYGEVVVIDENFGVRITNIVSSTERVKSLSR